MKLSALLLLSCFLPWLVMGQGKPTGLSSPILTNFWLRDFNIDPTQPNTKLITLNLNSQQFDNGGSTITITNLFGPGVTNIFETFITSNIFTTNLTVENFFVTNTVFTNISVFQTTITSNLFVTNIDASVTITTNLYVTNLFVTYEVVSNIVAGNIQGTPPHLAMFFPDDFSVSDSIVTQNNDTNGITVNGTGVSQIWLNGATGVDGQNIIWGGDRTNTLTRIGTDLVYSNSATIDFFKVRNAAGNDLRLGHNGTGHGLIDSTSGELFVASTMLTLDQEPTTSDTYNNGGLTQNAWWKEVGVLSLYVKGYKSITGDSLLKLHHTGVGGYIFLESTSSGDGGPARPVVVNRNIGALLTVGDTTFVDLLLPTQTNQLSGALTFAHATNGMDLVEFTHRRYFFNPSGANRLISLPAGWHNASGASFTVTNNTVVLLNVTSWGATDTSASQSNVWSSVTFLP